MLKDEVAKLLQKYLGNYVRGLNKEALKISVWQGDVELTNMQLKPEVLNALNLPVKVKAGFLGSMKLKVPWSRLGQDPVLVYIDRVFLLAEPVTLVEGSSEDAIQEAKKRQIREMEKKLLESRHVLDSEMSWLGSLINMVIGSLKLSISNIHIRYEDLESNPGHPFAAGVTIDELSALEETFITGGAPKRIHKSLELERMAIYLDSDISPWYVEKPWEDLEPSEWEQIFKFGTNNGKPATSNLEKHSHVLQPVCGNAKYSIDRPDASTSKDHPLQNASVNLDDVTLCLSKNAYLDLLKLVDNFTALNLRLRYAHYRPRGSVKNDPKSWWKYASRAVSAQMKKASGKLPWEQVLRYARLRKKYISLYAALLKSDLDCTEVDENEDLEELDRELDIEVIIEWRILAHKYVEQTNGSKLNLRKQKEKKSWWPFQWSSQHVKHENEPGAVTEEDWKTLDDITGYKGDEEKMLTHDKGDLLSLKLHMKHNALKLIDSGTCLADLSCDNLESCIKLNSAAKIVDTKLGSYRLLSPDGILAESGSASDSLVAVFCYKPLNGNVDWSVVAKVAPFYVTYLKKSVNQIIDFFHNCATVSRTLVQETASAVQMIIDELKLTVAKQVNRALKEGTRFFLDLDIEAPKVTIPTDFYPDSVHPTKLLLDLGKLVIRSQDDDGYASAEEINLYTQFDVVLRDAHAFLVDGDYSWRQSSLNRADHSSKCSFISFLPVIDNCGVFLKLQQIRSPVASFPSTRVAMRLPSIAFHFSPSRHHRLIQVAKIFQGEHAAIFCPWDEGDDAGWLYHLARKGTTLITGLIETISDSEDSKINNRESTNSSTKEKLFFTGLLDELKICISYSSQHDNQSFSKMLLAEEKRLLEFRAIGGHVELSYRANNIFIGTVLKALEVEDLLCHKKKSKICYFAISLNKNANTSSPLHLTGTPTSTSNDISQVEGDDEFYDASNNFNDSVGSLLSPADKVEYMSSRIVTQAGPDLNTPCFVRIVGLLPSEATNLEAGKIEFTDSFNSFVKAQIVIFEQNSPLYSNVDKQVAVTLSTLSFYCRRPTILAIMEFVNALNSREDTSSTAVALHCNAKEIVNESLPSARMEEPLESLLVKGKSRVIFCLLLNMACAEIILMKENETKLATLAHETFSTHIKVSPASYSIKASLGNLRISDDSLHRSHMYFWACDMRSLGGNSFIELLFCSFNADDEDCVGCDYSLLGQLSEVRIVYLNRFIQEVTSYFMGLISSISEDALHIKFQETDSRTAHSEIGSFAPSAVKLDLSLKKPIILIPHGTDSIDYLKLDVDQITVQNTFRLFGDINEMEAVHVEILQITVEDINLRVGSGSVLDESIIKNFKGVSFVIQRAIRDLSHQIPSIEVTFKIEELKASLSNKELEFIIECAKANISETPNLVPPLKNEFSSPVIDVVELRGSEGLDPEESERERWETWFATKVSLHIDLVELSLHCGVTRGVVSLATLQVIGLWLLYKSNTSGECFLSTTLKDLVLLDDRRGTEMELRLVLGKPDIDEYNPKETVPGNMDKNIVESSSLAVSDRKNSPAILILDARTYENSTSVSLCIQRPQFLVALDFFIAIVEFFVPTVHDHFSCDDNASSSQFLDALILDQPLFCQPFAEFSISPQKPLVTDDERFDHFIYDGGGGILSLKDRHGQDLTYPSMEALIYVGNGKTLKFRNVTITSGEYLDSCILLGANSSYSVDLEDNVFLEGGDYSSSEHPPGRSTMALQPQRAVFDKSMELIFELQAIGPEITFYNKSRSAGELIRSNKFLHAQMDAFCRLVLSGDAVEMNAEALGFTMNSNGIKILEPFDASVKFSKDSLRTNMKLAVSEIFMNFSFSVLRLFLDVEEDILSFLRTSKKSTVLCSEFDRIGTIKYAEDGQVCAIWRPRAPTGFSVLGDYLTPVDEPPTKAVVAVNSSLIKVKRPESLTLIWPPSENILWVGGVGSTELTASEDCLGEQTTCSIWFPEAPNGYVALGCVASPGREQPPLSSVFCISSDLVSPCGLRDCINIGSVIRCPNLAFWRVDNAVGTFLPCDPATLSLTQKAYEMRHLHFRFWEISPENPKGMENEASTSVGNNTTLSKRSSTVNPRARLEVIDSFWLIWCNRGSGSRKKMSIWRPIVPEGMVYFGDIAFQGYERPNTCIVLQDSEDSGLCKAPSGFELIGHIKGQGKMDSISFWEPQAPPGFVTLGCVACKGTPKTPDFISLRCIRADMISNDKFLDESVWDTSGSKYMEEPLSIWAVANELRTFIVWKSLRKPSRRLALKLSSPAILSGFSTTIIDAKIRTFSVTLFDDHGDLVVPLCNISLSGIGISLHGRPDYLNFSAIFSSVARSYNDKYDSWEPVVEPVDGSLRYCCNPNSPGEASELQITSTTALNLNVSISNTNMILQAYSSWNNLSYIQESREEANSPTSDGRSMLAVDERRSYYIVPQNKLGRDIFIKASEVRRFPDIIKMLAGDTRALKLPVPNNMLDTHLKGSLLKETRLMVTIIIVEAELLKLEGLPSHMYSVRVRLYEDQSDPRQTYLNQQSARTCGSGSDGFESSDVELVRWNEVFFFKVDQVDHCMLELTVTETGRGEPVSYCSSSLIKLTTTHEKSDSKNYLNDFFWLELSSGESTLDASRKFGRIRCAVFVPVTETEYRKSGLIQISPTREGPWTAMRLNYGSPVACLRLGNDVVASEVSVDDGNRYVNIRSLVSVRNDTEFALDLCLKLRAANRHTRPVIGERMVAQYDGSELATDELFESQEYNSVLGWCPCTNVEKEMSGVDLPLGWEWVDEWHVDSTSVNTVDGWAYAPDFESLKWPDSYNSLKCVNFARQRRWIRNRKCACQDFKSQVVIGPLKPGETIPIPLPCLDQSTVYLLHLKPSNMEGANQYSWSSVTDISAQSEDVERSKELSEICVSTLTVSEKLLHCSEISGSSSNGSPGMWFCMSIQATDIAKDVYFNAIQDWIIVVRPPVSIANYLPLMAEISLLEMQPGGHFLSCYKGLCGPGEMAKVYSADIRNPLYFSLLPQRGWLPVQDAILLSHPSYLPSRTISLRSSDSGRIAVIILEQNHVSQVPLQPKIIKVYPAYWFGVARCPPLSFRFVDVNPRRLKNNPQSFLNKRVREVILEEITEEETHEGFTIASALNFKSLGLCASMGQSGGQQFGPVKDLSPLGDMDGSLDVIAYDADENCMQLFVSSKPCPYQSVPTKVISVRPFMTFTNRIGQNMLLKFGNEDEPKNLRVSDTRVSFVHRKTVRASEIQVRLHDTDWSFPIKIVKEDTITLALKKHDGTRRFLRTEIRGYEDGSRFIVVFSLGAANGPIRIENRTRDCSFRLRQTGFGDDDWVQLRPLSTASFSWEDPYGQEVIDIEVYYGNYTEVYNGSNTEVYKYDLEKAGFFEIGDYFGLYLHIANIGNIKVVRFMNTHRLLRESEQGSRALVVGGNRGSSHIRSKMPEQRSALQVKLELDIVGISVVDHRSIEIAYIYMEKIFISYYTGYDGGWTTNRFKLELGYMQLDNQLPLTVMPVLLAPDSILDVHHPVFKMIITVRNECLDAFQIYPYIYIQVIDKNWKLNIHEPIIWAFADFFSNLRLDCVPKNSSVSQVDAEIRVDFLDISEVRVNLSFEAAAAQRPHGLLGVWGSVLSAVGKTYKTQVHLRKVTDRDRFLRKGSVFYAIGNRRWKDLIYNPLHLIFFLDVLGLTNSTLASLSKGVAELSTDEQLLQLRPKQVWPISGALNCFSLTVDESGASWARCFDIVNNKKNYQRIRNPRAFHADNILREYSEREAIGQMILHLAEESRNFGCIRILKKPSKFAWSDNYEDHFIVPYQRIVLVTSKRVMLLQCVTPDRVDERPYKILWDVPWEEVVALELGQVGYSSPSHLIIHLNNFRRGKSFVRVIRCSTELLADEREPQAVRVSSVMCKMWEPHRNNAKKIARDESFAGSEVDVSEHGQQHRASTLSTVLSSSGYVSNDQGFVGCSINFLKIWSSERKSEGRSASSRNQSLEGEEISIWRPVCPDGYVWIGDIARSGSHPPNVAAIYRNSDKLFAFPVGYDLIWRNCLEDYKTPVSIWHPRAPEGYVSLGCVAIPNFVEPDLDSVYCVAESLCEETTIEEHKIWSAPNSYPWGCHIYQSNNDTLHFVALRQPLEESHWEPKKIIDNIQINTEVSSSSRM